MVESDRSECACESPEEQRGIPEGTSRCPSIVHSHTESPGVLSGYSATWLSFSLESEDMTPGGKGGASYSLEDVRFRRMRHNEGRGVLLNVLVLARELPEPLEDGPQLHISWWPLTRLKAALVAMVQG